MLVFAEAYLPIRRVDARSDNIDNNLARTGHRIGKLAVLKHVRSAVACNESCLHLALHSALKPVAFTMRAQRSDCRMMSARNSAPLSPDMSKPCAASWAGIPGSACAAWAACRRRA